MLNRSMLWTDVRFWQRLDTYLFTTFDAKPISTLLRKLGELVNFNSTNNIINGNKQSNIARSTILIGLITQITYIIPSKLFAIHGTKDKKKNLQKGCKKVNVSIYFKLVGV